MGQSTGLILALGMVASASSTALAILDVIFAVVLSQATSPEIMRLTAIVASAFSTVTAVLIIGLLVWQIRYWGGAQMHARFGEGRSWIYLLIVFAAGIGILADVASAMMLGIMKARISDTPQKVILSSTEMVIDGTFAVWGLSMLSQGTFVVTVVILRRRSSRDQFKPHEAPLSSQGQPEMGEVLGPRAESGQGKQEGSSMKSGASSLKGKSRSGSDPMASLRSSWTYDRSMTSQTKLISSKTIYKSASLDDISKSTEDGFDSWDTSAVDPDAREAVELASPTRTTLLETIPASPATSRSASPGYPLDLEPPKQRKRPRKYSSANFSHGQRPKTSPSKIESPKEAHIHPLFRTASSEPPPAVTPGTMVTAAPGAGQVISDRSSLRSTQRQWNNSRSSSPLKHSNSLDNIRWPIGDEDEETPEESEERTITPPIPDWIMTAGSRSSLVGYNARRKSETGTASEDVMAI